MNEEDYSLICHYYWSICSGEQFVINEQSKKKGNLLILLSAEIYFIKW